jgi:TPR repeat protein
MKYNRWLSKWLGAHIIIISALLFLAIGLPLESCFDSHNPIIVDQKISKDVKDRLSLQLPSPLQADSKGAYLDSDSQLSSSAAVENLSLDYTQEQQVQEQASPSDQRYLSSLIPSPSYVPKSISEKTSVDNEAIRVNSFNEERQNIQEDKFLTQSKTVQTTKRVVKKQKDDKKEQFLREKENKLVSKIFKTREGGYMVKFYKEGKDWKANIIEKQGDYEIEFDLPAYMELGEDLEQNIEALLKLGTYGDDQITTGLIQVVLPRFSKEQEGYVYIGGLLGGGRKKAEIQQVIEEHERKGKIKETKEKKKKSTQPKQKGLAKKQKSEAVVKKRKQESIQEEKVTKNKKRNKAKKKDEEKRIVSERTIKSKKRKPESEESEGFEISEPSEEGGNYLPPQKVENNKKARITRSNSHRIEAEAKKNEEERLKKEREDRLNEGQEERVKIIRLLSSEQALLELNQRAERGEVEAQYQLAQYQLGKYVEVKKVERGQGGSKNKQSSEFLKEAINGYLKAVFGGKKEAIKILITLRDNGLYSSPDEEAMGWYMQAVKDSGVDFSKFRKKASKRLQEFEIKYQRKVSNTVKGLPEKSKKKNKGKDKDKEGDKQKEENKEQPRTRRPPMRISDLIVMALDSEKVPARIEWGGDYASPAGANADSIFGPLFKLPNTEEYEDVIMAIDPSGQGEDETAYCIAKRYGDHYFIIDMGGLAGGYYPEGSKDRIGNSAKVLRELISIAHRYKVKTVIFENNNDKSYGKLLERKLKDQGKLDLKIISKHQNINKEQKVIDKLQSLLCEHKLIIDKNTLQKDFSSTLIKDLNYKFFYQLMSVVEISGNSEKYFDGKNPKHDDRVDVVTDAIRYLIERKSKLDQLKKELEGLRRSAEQGDIKAQIEVGRRLKDGVGTEIDYKEAHKWYQMVVDRKVDADKEYYAEALFSLAQMYQKNLVQVEEEQKTEKGKERDEKITALQVAIQLYENSDEKGCAGAAYELAKLFQNGDGVEQDKERAATLLKKAVERDHAGAAYELGKIYQQELRERTTEESFSSKKVFKLFKKAANQGHIEAAYELGQVYENGNEVKQDFKEAYKWYKKAAQRGHLQAQVRIGGVYYNVVEGIKQSYRKAFRWYIAAAENEKEDLNAQYKVAIMYLNGWGIDKDEIQAFKWCKLAAKQGHVGAQFELGKMYENSLGTNQVSKKARKWYTMAAAQNHGGAQFNLAGMYTNGKGGAKNEADAVELYERAAEQGYADANVQLGWMYDRGEGVGKNSVKALEYYRKAAELKNKEEKIRL